ncbi:hypothetical protein ACOME3_002292 [Neoechinorhynchus agilis]
MVAIQRKGNDPYRENKKLQIVITVDEIWNRAKEIIQVEARKHLSVTKTGKRYIDRDPKLWTDEVKKKVYEKKRMYHVFLKKAKIAVASARTAHYTRVSTKQNIRENDHIEKLPCINHISGVMNVNKGDVSERWHQSISEIVRIPGPVSPINTKKVQDAINRMKPGKAIGPDSIATLQDRHAD